MKPSIPFEVLKSRIASSSNMRSSLEPKDATAQTITFHREGQLTWNLIGNSGSASVLTTGLFAEMHTDVSGADGAPNASGTSQLHFYQTIQVSSLNETKPDGQNVRGNYVETTIAMLMFCGKTAGVVNAVEGGYHIAASDMCLCPQNGKLQLRVLKPPRDVQGASDVGDHFIFIYNQGSNALLYQAQVPISYVTTPEVMWIDLSPYVNANQIDPGVQYFRTVLVSTSNQKFTANAGEEGYGIGVGSMSGFGYFYPI